MALYRRDDSPFWWASISVPGRPRLRLSTDTADRREAQAFHDRLRGQLLSEPVQAPRGARLSTVVLAWCRAEHRGEPDILAIRKFMRAYGDPPLHEVVEDRDGIDRALRSFVTTPGNYTRYRNRLRAILQMARDEGLISEVPTLRKWEAVRKPTHRWVRQDKFPDLLRELAPHQRPMVLFAVHTGLRQANVLGLTWDRVDLERRLVWVHAIETKANKTLSLPLNDVAVAVLKGQQGLHSQYVFVYQGRPIKEIKTAFQKACIRAGLGEEIVTVNKTNKSGKSRSYIGLRWHDLRHTFASWHAQSGTPPQVIKELGGWASMQMVERYTHLSPSFTASFANNIAGPTHEQET